MGNNNKRGRKTRAENTNSPGGNGKSAGNHERSAALVIDDLTEVVARFLPDGTFTFVNQVYCRFFGKAKDTLIGNKWQPGALPEDLPHIESLLKTLSPSNPVVTIENRVYSASGRVHWMQFVNRGFFDSEGTLTEIQSVGRDITERKLAEEGLHKSQLLLREIETIGNIGGWEFNIDSLNQTWTDGVYRIHEVDKTFDPTVKSGIPFYAPEARPVIEAAVQRAIESGEPFDVELPFITAKGHRRWVRAIGKASLEDRRVYGFFQDVTDRRSAEEALRRSQVELAAIYDNAPILMCVLDASRQVIYANKALVEFVGRPVDEIKKERACGVIGCLRALDDPQGCGHGPYCAGCNVRLAMMDALETGRSHHGLEYRATTMYEGKPRHLIFLASVAPIELAEKPNLLLCLQDITERQRIEEELRSVEESYHLLVDTSMDAVFMTSLDGKILSANPAACQMIGLSEPELIRRGRSAVVDASDPILHRALEERARTGRFRGELTCLRADGSKFPAETSSAVFRDRKGGVRSSVIIRDISERRQLEKELKASHEQLRALTVHLQTAIEEERAHIAREIHDVLTHDLIRLKFDLVWLNRQLAKTEKTIEPEALLDRVTQMVKLTDTSIQHAQELATRLRPAVLDSLGLCSAVEWQTQDFQQRSGIRCCAIVPAEEIPLNPDVATAAFRILQESLTNVARHANASRVDVLLKSEADQIILRVQDNGRGIPAGKLENPLSFGLSSMRERALLQGGQLEIRSLQESGTVIEARFPHLRKQE